MNFANSQCGNPLCDTSGYPPSGTFENAFGITPAHPHEGFFAYLHGGISTYSHEQISEYTRGPYPTTQPPEMSRFFNQTQGMRDTAPRYMPTSQPYQYSSDAPGFHPTSPADVQPHQRMQSQEQQYLLAEANKRIWVLERQLESVADHTSYWKSIADQTIYWKRRALQSEALAEERAPKPVPATKLFQNPGNLSIEESGILSSNNVPRTIAPGVVSFVREPQEAIITARNKSSPNSDKIITDLTGADDFGAASFSPVSSDPIISKSSSQSSNSRSFSVDKAAKKEYEWLIGGNPMRSPKKPRPYEPGQIDEQPDNISQFGSYLSTANGRKTYSELERKGSAKKKQRSAGSQKSKATSGSKAASRFKAPSKPPRAAKRMKTEVASSAEVEDSNKENEQTLIQPSLPAIHQTFSIPLRWLILILSCLHRPRIKIPSMMTLIMIPFSKKIMIRLKMSLLSPFLRFSMARKRKLWTKWRRRWRPISRPGCKMDKRIFASERKGA